MPLLTSPIDGSPMRQVHRYGIEIDVCPTSGGVWLDKGELEKILHMIQEDAVQQAQYDQPAPPPPPRPSHGKHERWGDDDDYHRYQKKGYYGSGKYRKKEGTLSRVMDLFDF